MAQVVSFINYKGEVGKTTIAVETAATLARKFNFKVLIVDLDPQTNASFYLVTEGEWEDWATRHGSLKEVLEAAINEGEYDVSATIMKDLYDCLDLLPSHLDIFSIEVVQS